MSRAKAAVVRPVEAGSLPASPVLPGPLALHGAHGGDDGERGRAMGAMTTSIVQLHVEAFGKGPTAARTELRDGDHAMCFLRDTLTRIESTYLAAGRGDIVRSGREAVYAHLEPELRQIVEAGTQRPIVGFVPAVAPELGLVTLLFLLGPKV